MNIKDVTGHWVALHEALGLGAPITGPAAYGQALEAVEQLVDAAGADDDSPLWGLISLAGDRIRAYEERLHPWPDHSTPAQVLAALMEQHGLRQSELPEVGSQGVVSEVLSGKRRLNTRQVTALCRRFSVPAQVLI